MIYTQKDFAKAGAAPAFEFAFAGAGAGAAAVGTTKGSAGGAGAGAAAGATEGAEGELSAEAQEAERRRKDGSFLSWTYITGTIHGLQPDSLLMLLPAFALPRLQAGPILNTSNRPALDLLILLLLLLLLLHILSSPAHLYEGSP